MTNPIRVLLADDHALVRAPAAEPLWTRVQEISQILRTRPAH